MDNLPQLLDQPTLWGLTVGQTLGVILVAFVLLAGWIFVRVVMRLAGILFRLGCAAIIVFIGGLVIFLLLSNLTGQ